MAAEAVYNHNHDAGWFRSDWNYFTDASVDDAVARLREAAGDGLTADEVLEFIKSAVDLDQITVREARMMNAILESFYPRMEDGAERVADAFMSKMRSMITNLDDMDDEEFADFYPTFIGTRQRTGAGDSVVKGEELGAFMNELDQIAHPPPRFVAIPGLVLTGLETIKNAVSIPLRG